MSYYYSTDVKNFSSHISSFGKSIFLSKTIHASSWLNLIHLSLSLELPKKGSLQWHNPSKRFVDKLNVYLRLRNNGCTFSHNHYFINIFLSFISLAHHIKTKCLFSGNQTVFGWPSNPSSLPQFKRIPFNSIFTLTSSLSQLSKCFKQNRNS